MTINLRNIAVAATAILLAACDENTGSMGIIIDNDAISSSTETFQIYSSTCMLDSVVANTTKSYLGQVYDPETEAVVKAEFLAQFYTFEDYELPDNASIVKNADGLIEADSVELRLYFGSYYGDDGNPMRINIYELDRDNVLREDQTYYATEDLSAYVAEGAKPLATKTFTPVDYMLAARPALTTTTCAFACLRSSEPISFARPKSTPNILPTRGSSYITFAQDSISISRVAWVRC